MQGPQAFEKISAPSCSKVSIKPSLSIVCLTCSDPGVIVNRAFVLNPLFTAWLAIETDLEISSYEELVQDPIKPTCILVGQFSFSASSFILDIGVALSGVKGPLRCGSSLFRSISNTWS